MTFVIFDKVQKSNALISEIITLQNPKHNLWSRWESNPSPNKIQLYFNELLVAVGGFEPPTSSL